MAGPKKQIPLSHKLHNAKMAKGIKKTQEKSRNCKISAKTSQALKKTVTQPEDDIRVSCFLEISISQMLEMYRSPTDEMDAKTRMADALWLYEWNIAEHYMKDESLKGSSNELIGSPSFSPSSSKSSVAKDTAVLPAEQADEIIPPSPTSSLSSHGSAEIKEIDKSTQKNKESAPNLSKNGSNSVGAPDKLPRGQACVRCKTRKLKCTLGATCAPCVQAAVPCIRPGV